VVPQKFVTVVVRGWAVMNHDYLIPYHCRDLLETKERRDDVCKHLMAVLGKNFITCEVQLAGPEYERLQGFYSLPPAVAEELFSCELSNKGTCILHDLNPNISTVKKATIKVDNSLSPAHTLLQVQCIDQKCLLYDILRTSKDCDIQVLLQSCLVMTGFVDL
jgi:hypothetical protein